MDLPGSFFVGIKYEWNGVLYNSLFQIGTLDKLCFGAFWLVVFPGRAFAIFLYQKLGRKGIYTW